MLLSNYSRISTIVWLHHLVFNKALGEKATSEQYKDTVYCLEQILWRTPVRSLASHLTNQPSKTNKTLLEKKGQTNQWHFPVSFHIWTFQCLADQKRLPFNSSERTLDALKRTEQARLTIIHIYTHTHIYTYIQGQVKWSDTFVGLINDK